MSITSTAVVTDPYSSLAWSTSLVILALEKLLVTRTLESPKKDTIEVELTLDDDEREALEIVADELSLLSEASEIPVNDLFIGKHTPLRSALRESFSTLVAIEKDTSPVMNHKDFEKIAEELRQIKLSVESASIDSLRMTTLEDAQKVCLDLLEHIDRQRPTISLH